MLTLPIHIGNVSLDKKLQPLNKALPSSSVASGEAPTSISTPDTSTSASTPREPPQPAPKPAPRPAPRSRNSSHNVPSAPPAEHHHLAEGGTPVNESYPNKRQSQLVSPNAFSYAPGLFFSQDRQNNGPVSASSGSTGATVPYPTEEASSMPTPLILPPDYGASGYPPGQFANVHSIKKLK